MPFTFYLVCLTIFLLGIYAFLHQKEGWGLPALVVLATVSVWYVGDVLYNDYENYIIEIGNESLERAWWQVMCFLIGFGISVGPVHRYFNRSSINRHSVVVHMLRYGVSTSRNFQSQLDKLFWVIVPGWCILMSIALIRTSGDFAGLFAPWLGELATPWNRGRIGAGLDSLLSFGGYLQLFFTAAFGVIAALADNPRTRGIAFAIFVISFPYYVFGRARNTMLSSLLPGLLSWVFLRLRTTIVIKLAIMFMSFWVVESWMKFVIANRTGMSIAQAIVHKGFSTNEKTRHLGLNMFKELGFIDSFIESGTYRPNWGARYFAELVNPIPRVLWKSKPLIGLDYAIARGMGWDNASGKQGGVAASISTGMIGQGVVNFGRFLGPLASAFLMALWVSLLASNDLRGNESGRLLLYVIGLILTFNMGRDITLLVVYPFLFGMLFLWIRERMSGDRSNRCVIAKNRRSSVNSSN